VVSHAKKMICAMASKVGCPGEIGWLTETRVDTAPSAAKLETEPHDARESHSAEVQAGTGA
jgi:hypothetical protein